MNENTPFTACYLILTDKCNLRCKYCYEDFNKCSEGHMTFDTAKKSADFLIDNAIKTDIRKLSWTFFGGEPLLNIDVMIKFLRYSLDKANKYNLKLNFSLVTNGTIYSNQYEKFLLEWYKEVKHINIYLSTDGIPEVHDKNRVDVNGKSTSGIVSENILKLKKFFKQNQIETYSLRTNSVITRDTISKVFLSYKYLRQLGINESTFQLSHEEDWNDNDTSIYIEQLSLISDFIYDQCIKSGNLIPYKKANLIIGDITESICEAGKALCAISPSGDIYPCGRAYSSNRNLSMGNVTDGIIDNDSRKPFSDACRSDMHAGNISCGKCENTACKVCMVLNHQQYNDVLKCNPGLCSIYKAKGNFIIETKKKFEKLSQKLNYDKCNEMTFFKAIN